VFNFRIGGCLSVPRETHKDSRMLSLLLLGAGAVLVRTADGQTNAERYLMDSPYNLCRQPLYHRSVFLTLLLLHFLNSRVINNFIYTIFWVALLYFVYRSAVFRICTVYLVSLRIKLRHFFTPVQIRRGK
jgi:hypothetical protein